MSRKVMLTLGLALILAMGGIATASNMGFKLNKQYVGGSQVNTVSLPYFQSQFTNANQLWADILGAQNVCRVNTSFQLSCWGGPGSFGDFFTINNQDGYVVQTSANTTEIIVGSHDPALGLTLLGGGVSNVKSLPYHTTYQNANQMWVDIPGAQNVCRINGAFQPSCWGGPGSFGDFFPIVLGDAYMIQVMSNTSWTPDHY